MLGTRTLHDNTKLPYALRDTKLVHISEAERGLACDCICPSCQSPLIARKGNVRQHHFAHYSSVNCEYGLETALHLAAKEQLARSRQITLPSVRVTFSTSHPVVELSPVRTFEIDRVELEHRLDAIIPDVVLFMRDKLLLLEIVVTHPVDGEKLSKIRRLGLSTVEVDLCDMSRDFSPPELAEILVNRVDRKRWLYNLLVDNTYSQLLKMGRKKHTVERGCALHVDDCPIPARVWHGKAYANVIDDCSSCKHAVDVGPNMGYIICDGHLSVGTSNRNG